MKSCASSCGGKFDWASCFRGKFDWPSCFGAKKVWSSALVILNKDATRNLTHFTSGYISRLNRLLITPDHHVRTHTWESIAQKYSMENMNIFYPLPGIDLGHLCIQVERVLHWAMPPTPGINFSCLKCLLTRKPPESGSQKMSPKLCPLFLKVSYRKFSLTTAMPKNSNFEFYGNAEA